MLLALLCSSSTFLVGVEIPAKYKIACKIKEEVNKMIQRCVFLQASGHFKMKGCGAILLKVPARLLTLIYDNALKGIQLTCDIGHEIITLQCLELAPQTLCIAQTR